MTQVTTKQGGRLFKVEIIQMLRVMHVRMHKLPRALKPVLV